MPSTVLVSMARVVINPDTPDAWEQELPPGTYNLGRSESNHLPLDHPSVSAVHCELSISDDTAILRDLGSTAGTFVDGQLIERARLHSGQVFTLGEVQIKYLTGPASAQPAPAAAQVRASGAAIGTTFAEAIAHTRPPAEPVSFFAELPRTLTYPFKGNGPILLGGGALFFLVLGFLPFIGILLSGYLFSYLKRMVATSATGEEEPPDWPDFTNWIEDMILPYLHMLALVVLTFAPGLLLPVFLPEDLPLRGVFIALAVIYALLLAPMGMLALSMFDTVAALNPIPLVVSIGRIPGQYFVAALAFGAVLLAYAFAETALALLPIPFLPSILAGFLNLYLLAVAMRILGLLYRANKNRLGWFNR